MLDEVWQLKVVDRQGGAFGVCGSKQNLDMVYDQWRSCEFDQGPISIEGFADDAIRSPIKCAIRYEDISAMYLVKL